MNRRLLRHFVDNYDDDRAIRDLVDSTELWFVPVANPDGYDFTFTEGNRLWRKNLRDNDDDGRITAVDGVDLNRNFPTKWGYDNEGSSAVPGSETYRGAAPASEPETQAYDALLTKSVSRSWSTTTPQPPSCCTAPGSRSPPRPRTT